VNKLWNNYKVYRYNNLGLGEYRKNWRQHVDNFSSGGIPETISKNQNEKGCLGRPLLVKRWKDSVL
jgi:hypothetical protein